ncbi:MULTISPECIES: hypothetical protein [Kitasatospora]|uniref:hypothetical protein n=1 Tax=Kitasatospora TaxID=2063 RepID=UPI0031E1ECED
MIAGVDACFSPPALTAGTTPPANLLLGRVAGSRMAQQTIFFSEQVEVTGPPVLLLCDEVVPPEALDATLVARPTGWRTWPFGVRPDRVRSGRRRSA